jgi:hypothetical protein
LENIIKDFSIVIDDVILRKIKRLRFIWAMRIRWIRKR